MKDNDKKTMLKTISARISTSLYRRIQREDLRRRNEGLTPGYTHVIIEALEKQVPREEGDDEPMSLPTAVTTPAISHKKATAKKKESDE